MSPLRNRWRALAAAVSMLLAPLATLPAQTSQTAGAIRGRVTGTAGAPMTAAVVTAVSQETGLSRSTQAGDDGIYVLRLLPSGTYRVTARRIGSAPSEQSGIRVTVGQTTTANFVLRDAAVQLSTVQVSAAAARVDVTQGGVQQNVSTEEIASLPTLGRDFTDFINLSGLVSPSPEATTGGQFSIAGARPSQTNLQMDGVDANNSFFGENRGGSRIPFNFSIESVKEFQIITNGFDVEYGNYAGGVINIISKGGTNRRRSTAYANYRGEQVTAANFDGTRPNNFEVQQFALQTEGPVVRDRLFYFFSADAQRRREPFVPVSAATLRSGAAAAAAQAAGLPAADTAGIRLRNQARNDSLTADSLSRFYNILESKYGIQGAEANYNAFSTSNDVLTLFGRLDWNLGSRSRLSLRNSFAKYNNANETFAAVSTGGLSKAEAFKNMTNSAVAELTSVLPRGVSNVLRAQYSTERRPRVGNNLLPELRVTNVSGGRAFAYGGQSIAFNNRLEEDKIQVIDNVTFESGNHNFKLGTNNLFASYYNAFWNQGSGFYTFDNLRALDEMRPSRYTRSVRQDGSTPVAEFSTQEYSIYAQDDWQLTPKLLTSFGLRYDVSRFNNRPGRVIDVERALGLQTGLAPVDKNNVSPRLSIAYDVSGNGSQVIRAGTGLFYGRLPAVLGGNVAATQVPMLTLDCSGSIAENDPNAPPSVAGYAGLAANGSQNPVNCASAAGIGGVPEYSFWTDDFELPETFRANLGYERLLARNLRFSADYIVTSTTKLYTVRNLNLRPAQFALANEGGRQVFVPAGLFSPSLAATPLARHLNTNFADIFVNYNDGQARSQALTFNLDQRFSDQSSLRGSYTYTTAADNSSFSCCTSNAGFTEARIGAFGPNTLGGVGDTDKGWGPSAFVRNHTFVLSGFTRLPLGFRVSGVWRLQSGTPWGPEQGGDLNGDGVSFNDRPFIFAPEDLPVSVPTSATTEAARNAFIAATRERYAGYLADNECLGDYVGQIIPRNTCRQPWFNRLDLSLRNRIPTRAGQTAELSIDLFNVLNGLNRNWGRYEAVTTSSRNLLTPTGFDAAGQRILYTVPTEFGRERTLGANLLLQFSAQVGVRYSF